MGEMTFEEYREFEHNLDRMTDDELRVVENEGDTGYAKVMEHMGPDRGSYSADRRFLINLLMVSAIILNTFACIANTIGIVLLWVFITR